MRGYTKEFLVDAFLSRYKSAGIDTTALEKITRKFYDTVTKEKFRQYCSLDAAYIREYKNGLNR